MSAIPPPAWRTSRTTAPAVKPRDRSIWPGLLIIVGVPTLLFAIEYATGTINV